MDGQVVDVGGELVVDVCHKGFLYMRKFCYISLNIFNKRHASSQVLALFFSLPVIDVTYIYI